jgi:hypothetical protein
MSLLQTGGTYAVSSAKNIDFLSTRVDRDGVGTAKSDRTELDAVGGSTCG